MVAVRQSRSGKSGFGFASVAKDKFQLDASDLNHVA